MASRNRRNIKFDELYARGEMGGPDGFRADTANGTAFATGTGWNKFPPSSGPQVDPGGVWPAGRSDRTGE